MELGICVSSRQWWVDFYTAAMLYVSPSKIEMYLVECWMVTYAWAAKFGLLEHF